MSALLKLENAYLAILRVIVIGAATLSLLLAIVFGIGGLASVRSREAFTAAASTGLPS